MHPTAPSARLSCKLRGGAGEAWRYAPEREELPRPLIDLAAKLAVTDLVTLKLDGYAIADLAERLKP